MPALTPEAALALADRHWRIRGVVRALPSYADQNFRISGEQGDYVLKVAHPAWAGADLDLENQAMLTLAAREPALQWPRVMPSVGGEHLLALPMEGGVRHVRLLSFVPGMTYAVAIDAVSRQHRPALHESLGRAVGLLIRGLAGFRHPAAARAQDWNLMSLPDVRDETDHIEDAALRAIVAAQVESFCAQLPAWRTQLPITVLHNDANDLNVIVALDGEGGGGVSAVIDFGDMCTSFRLCELAIACTYAMQHEADPVACAQAIVCGCLELCPLQRVELEQLHAFILARLCHSVLMATRAHREQPDNPFVLVSQQGVRALLRTLAGTDPHAIVAPFLEACHE
ncbi:phosphotransferase [Rhodanobacter sp. DHB23]|uniref:phosphotransferase n=1 Tax=Rhodanobacter sp. DHB23 TaxID=2775923 RepID=UPI001782B6C1|nr:phosphotransferase [Rhodanobacter sp. DHB23]MBD8872751.1 phosphotransferase [Rhodanobacter sp. DHB23]